MEMLKPTPSTTATCSHLCQHGKHYRSARLACLVWSQQALHVAVGARVNESCAARAGRHLLSAELATG